MDDKWFKAQQKKVGVTADAIAGRLGKSRSNVSHIYNGRQKMTLEWAQAFSDALEVPIDEVLTRAGVVLQSQPPKESMPIQADTPTTARRTRPPGALSEENAHRLLVRSDQSELLALHQGNTTHRKATEVAGALGLNENSEMWEVNSYAVSMCGYMPGDIILADRGLSELCKPGDIVVADVANWGNKGKTTILRKYDPPALVPAAGPNLDQRIHIVDFVNVVIRAKVIASWRS
ncbi:helix-turn-helix domain-containing protein [Pseudooceanicola algae]|uniref:Uncharacterized protein n=1 Tax=Pseudooceanicola algae TaxID=1537215 RepID=A0A418SKD4_9RHOB|nr:helix-turn-helix transcriptional regulator [Pseudooceanicola algae]QPM89136.1 hypothetical protein PSAL_003470 [Pseudooceanicola algae]